ncbi:MAG TPA: PEP/pyruvate-binding domain-containing protein [Mycobacteriales bacterium]|nr:PEP/pyruvate-binding domain-containing protein [Mycobacteriales bacterium]
MPEFVPLDRCGSYPVEQVGGKARTLARLLAAGLSVPDGVCLPVTGFARLRAEFGLDEQIAAELDRARAVPATLGSALATIRRAIRELPRPSWVDGQPLPGLLEAGPVAVRSSAPSEDAVAGSAAGIYESVLDCRNVEQVWDAILTVWASLFSERVNYYRDGHFDADMAVIIQRQVSGMRTGVLFSRHPLTGVPEPYVELAEAAEGVTAATGAVETSVPGLDRIARLCAGVVGGDADVEIAVGGGRVIVLQARPAARLEPVAMTGVECALQEDVAAVRRLPLGECAPLFMRQLVKHVPYRQACRELGIPLYDVYYLAYRWDALDALPEFAAETLQVRWSGAARVTAPASDLAAVLWDGRRHNVVGESTSCAQIGTVVPASATGLSARTAAGSVVVEAFPARAEGLKSGRTAPSMYLLEDSGAVLESDTREVSLRPERLAELARITTAVADRLGEVRLEWYLTADGILVKDLSIERSALAGTPSVLAPGLAAGPALLLEDLEPLEAPDITDRVSVTEHENHADIIDSAPPLADLVRRARALAAPPVVVAPYPSLGLIPLIPYTAGFVFEQGNLLCHLAIVLREREIPGYVLPGISSVVPAGRSISVGPDGLQLMS